MDYPSVAEINCASPKQLLTWWRNLHSPVTGAESSILRVLSVKIKALHENAEEWAALSKKVGWNRL